MLQLLVELPFFFHSRSNSELRKVYHSLNNVLCFHRDELCCHGQNWKQEEGEQETDT